MQRLERANWIHTVDWSSPVLGYQSRPCSVHLTGGKKAMHEEDSFDDMIFVNHTTSQTWSFLENEQFCIKWSISVNGGVLTSSHRAQCCPECLVKWNCWGWAGAQDCAPQPPKGLLYPRMQRAKARGTFPFVKNGLGKDAGVL